MTIPKGHLTNPYVRSQKGFQVTLNPRPSTLNPKPRILLTISIQKGFQAGDARPGQVGEACRLVRDPLVQVGQD